MIFLAFSRPLFVLIIPTSSHSYLSKSSLILSILAMVYNLLILLIKNWFFKFRWLLTQYVRYKLFLCKGLPPSKNWNFGCPILFAPNGTNPYSQPFSHPPYKGFFYPPPTLSPSKGPLFWFLQSHSGKLEILELYPLGVYILGSGTSFDFGNLSLNQSLLNILKSRYTPLFVSFLWVKMALETTSLVANSPLLS